jgi:subtilase family serine protease
LDVYLTSRFNGGLNATASEAIANQVLTIPQNTPVGTYYLIFYADYDQDEFESNELNNTASLPLTVSKGWGKILP